MSRLEEYAKDGEKRFETIKKQAILTLENGKMDRKFLERFLENAFKAGHYTGHCRGENYARTLPRSQGLG